VVIATSSAPSGKFAAPAGPRPIKRKSAPRRPANG